MKALVGEAHMLGLKDAVHAHGTSAIKDVIRAGVDTIEHASLADREAFALAKQHGTWFSMDIYGDDYILDPYADDSGGHRCRLSPWPQRE